MLSFMILEKLDMLTVFFKMSIKGEKEAVLSSSMNGWRLM